MRLAIVPCLTLAAACQSYPFQFQHNQRVAARGYTIDVGTAEQTDILFVVDNSGSMAEEQAELRDNMAAFIEVLTQSANDYQVGLISTDLERRPGPDCSPCCDLDTDDDGAPDWSNCDNGRLYATDFMDRIFERPPLVDQTPAEYQAEIDALVADFNTAILSLGINGAALEAPLEAMRRALDPDGSPIVTHLNRGFVRPDANLAVIFLTDEDDCSFPSSWYSEQGRDDAHCYFEPGATPIEEFVDFLVELKGGIEPIRAAAIVGGVPTGSDTDPVPFEAAGCFTVTDTLCDIFDNQTDCDASPHCQWTTACELTAPFAAEVGSASDACGCWTSRFLTDPRVLMSGDFFCNYLSEAPFNQTSARIPDAGHNQGGCAALPGGRLVAFLDEIARRRVDEGREPGVIADSICRAEYRTTLEEIAITVVLTNCFTLEEPPEDLDSVVMTKNGEEIPRVEPESSEPGWSYDEERNQICLEGGLTKTVGDVFAFSVVTETTGFGDPSGGD